MLAELLDALNLPREFWASLIGCSVEQLDEWRSGQREVPLSVADRLGRAIGVPRDVLLGKISGRQPIEWLPPLWLKARQGHLGEAEHKAIALARLLASRYDEVETLLEVPSYTYKTLFTEIKQHVDPQLPARDQGRVAAGAFLQHSTLDKGATGIGEVFRGFLRARGVLLLETPVDNANFQGFCLPVGADTRSRPCLLANHYKATWFRRNYVLLHELAHAIFDLEAANAVFDKEVPEALTGLPVLHDIAEERADSFALHALVSKRLLIAMEHRVHRFTGLDASGMARVVAETHAEQALVVRAALEYGLINQEDAARLRDLKIAEELRGISFHARGVAGLKAGDLLDPEIARWGARLTTYPVSGLRLPIPFVRLVMEALKQHKISIGRAAELLMVKRHELHDLYGIQIAQIASAVA